MKKIVRLTESNLTRIVLRVMNEMKDRTSGVEEMLDNNPKVSMAFDRLVDILKSNPEIKDELSSMVSESINEDDNYYDYSGTKGEEISRKSYWKEKLASIGIPAAVAAVIGYAISQAGGGTDILEMALGFASAGAGIGSTLISTTSRTKMGESDLTRIIKRVITERENEETSNINSVMDFANQKMEEYAPNGIIDGKGYMNGINKLEKEFDYSIRSLTRSLQSLGLHFVLEKP